MDTINTTKDRNLGINKFAHESDIIGDSIVLKNLLRENDLGRIFLGFDEKLKVNVYVKELNHKLYENVNVKGILNILKTTRHKNIVKIYDYIEQNGTYYIIFQYVNGVCLKDLLKIRKKSDSEVIKIMVQLCDILNYMFNNKIPHTYISPDNITVDNVNNIYLTDYVFCDNYIEKILESSAIEFNNLKYDIENLGHMLYYLISGRKFVLDENYEFSSEGINDKFINIINNTLGKNGKRYTSINEFKDDLLSYYETMKDHKDLPSVVISDNSKKEIKKDNNSKKKNFNFIKKILLPVAILGIIVLLSAIINRKLSLKNKNYPLVSSVRNNSQNFNNDFYLNNGTDNGDSDLTGDNNSVTGNNYDGEKNNSIYSGNTDTHGKAKADLINPNAVSGSLLNGTVNITVTDYTINDDNIIVKLHVQNNYKTSVELLNNKMHIRNEKNDMFLVDDELMQKNQPGEKKVPSIENKDFTFYFSGYKDSKELTLCIEDILSNSNKEDRNRTLELKFK